MNIKDMTIIHFITLAKCTMNANEIFLQFKMILKSLKKTSFNCIWTSTYHFDVGVTYKALNEQGLSKTGYSKQGCGWFHRKLSHLSEVETGR